MGLSLKGWGLTHHIKVDPTNEVKRTLCGRDYGHLTLAKVQDGEIWNPWRKLEDEEICQRCLKSFRKVQP